MHCDHCVGRYEREFVAVEAVCVVSLNYGECDTATCNCATEWSLRVIATQLLKKSDMGRNAAIEISGIKKFSKFRKTIHRFRFYDPENRSSNFMKYQ